MPGDGEMARDAVLVTNPDQRRKEIQAIQVGDGERCLTQRGYTKFAPTQAGQKTLQHHPLGSDARRRYLYRWATTERPP